MSDRLVFVLTGRVLQGLYIKRSAQRACLLFFLAIVSAFVLNPAAFAAEGDLDVLFGSGGRLLTDVSGVDDYGHAVLVQADGKIVVAGHSGDYPGPFHSSLARYNTDGSLDATFGQGGKVMVGLDALGDSINSLVQLSDGKILAGGFVYDYPWTFALIVARFNTDGSLDSTFAGGAGRVVFDYGDNSSQANEVLVAGDGKIYVVGFSGAGYLTDFVVTRFNADGTFDKRFGSGGKLRTHFEGGYGTGSRAYAAALQPDGKLIAAGEYHTDNGHAQFALARYNSDGSLDQTFGNGGKVTAPGPGSATYAYAIVIEPGGKLVVAGHQTTGIENGDFRLMRFLPDGNVDTAFGSGGSVVTDLAAGSDDIAFSLVRQPNGKLLVAGRMGPYPHFTFGVVRYRPDGSLDQGFGSGGKVVIGFDNFASQASAIALQADGKAVIGGYSISGTNGSNFDTDFAVARFNIRPFRAVGATVESP